MKKYPDAFTLVELLVSMTILTLLVVLVAGIVNAAGDLTTGSRQRMDADAEARMVFNRMERDFAGILQRSDVDYVFAKQPGNDRFAFYSNAAGLYDGTISLTNQHPFSVVGYQINNQQQLERISRGTTWGDYPQHVVQPFVFLPGTLQGSFSDLWTKANPVISTGIYRLEFTFLLTDGSISEDPFIPPNNTYEGLKDVRAVIIGIAVLPQDARRRLPALSYQMESALVDVAQTLPLGSWNATRNSSNFAQLSSLPEASAATVRLYQRHFYMK